MSIKSLLFFTFFVYISCVPAKKYKALQADFSTEKMKSEEKSKTITELQSSVLAFRAAVAGLEMELAHQKEKTTWLTKESAQKSERIQEMQQELKVVHQQNEAFAKKNDDLVQVNSVYSGITKNLLSELEVQNLKVMNLTLALTRQDSVNIHLIKKAKKEMSDKKYKKALEKLGFVFN